jgi:adenosylhomocysteine nucleosidase
MTDSASVRRVGMLAPMEPELEPIIRQIGMERDGDVCRGNLGNVEVVAMLTRIGLDAGADAARRIIEHDVDWVMVVGIAGGVDRTLTIGDVVVPERVLDRATGTTYTPTPVGDLTPHGTISCGDDLITDPGVLAGFADDGIVAVEMETAAIAPVCEAAERPWSVFRGISDFAADGLVDQELFSMTRPDGTGDRDAIKRYLEENPERARVLAQLAHDTNLATEAAASAAIRACGTL